MFSRCHLLPLLRRAVLIREFLVSLLFLTLLLPAQAAAPSWWAPRGVIVSGKTSDDYAAINQGQLKYLVSAAVAEMNAKLTGGAGSTLNGVVNAWTTNTAGADDYAVVTVGQLKAVAKPVYERLLAAGAISSLPTWVNGSGSDDYAVANIGQAKLLFSFELLDQMSLLTLQAFYVQQSMEIEQTAPNGLVVQLERNGAPVVNETVTFEIFQSLGGLVAFNDTNATPQPTFSLQSDTNGYASCQFRAPAESAYSWVRASATGAAPQWFLLTVAGGSGSFPSNPPGITGVDFVPYASLVDSDEDGVPDDEDIVPYDPSFKAARSTGAGTGGRKYAVIDMGIGYLSGAYGSAMGSSGTMVWQGETSDTWRAWSPTTGQTVDFTEADIASLTGLINVSITDIGHDGRLCGQGKSLEVIGEANVYVPRVFVYDPFAGSCQVFPISLKFSNHSEYNKYSYVRWGVGDNPTAVVEYQQNDITFRQLILLTATGEVLIKEVQKFERPPVQTYPEGSSFPVSVPAGLGKEQDVIPRVSSVTNLVYSDRVVQGQVEDYYIDGENGVVWSPRFLVDSDQWSYRLLTSAGQSLTLGTRDVLTESLMSFTGVSSHTPLPWIVASGMQAKPLGQYENPDHLWVPGAEGYESYRIYGSAEQYALEQPLDYIYSVNGQGAAWVHGYMSDGTIDYGVWANGEATSLPEMIGQEVMDQYYSWTWVFHGFSDQGTIAMSAYSAEDDADHMLMLVPVDFDVYPAENADVSTIVPADVHSIDLLAEFSSDYENVSGADVHWTVTEGGGTLSENVSSVDAYETGTQTTLTTSTHAGDTYKVEAEVTSLSLTDPLNEENELGSLNLISGSIKQKTGTITVGPGEAANIAFEVTGATGFGTGASVPADGQSTREITITVTDDYGNRVAAGAPVAWRLKGDGWFTDQFASYQRETDENGQAHATLLAGRIPGLSQTVIVETDFKREEFVIENTPLNFSLAAGGVDVTFLEAIPVQKTFTVTANVMAADGTPIRWRTSKGKLSNQTTSVQGGVATATVVVTPDFTGAPEDGFNGTAVVTAAVSKSTAITSVDLGGINTLFPALNLEPNGNSAEVQIQAPELAGQEVQVASVLSLQRQSKSFSASELQTASGILSGTPHASDTLNMGSFKAEVIVYQPDEGNVEAVLLEEPGVFTLELNADSQPVLKVQTNAGEDSVTLTETAIGLGVQTSITLTLTNESATISSGGYSASTPLRGPPLLGSLTTQVPVASLPRVASTAFVWQQPDNSGSVQMAGLTNGMMTLDAQGNGSFQASVPTSFTGTSVRLSVAASDANSAVPPTSFSLPVSRMGGAPSGETPFITQVVNLHTQAHFENRLGGVASIDEQRELARYGAVSAIDAHASQFQTGLDKLAPLENGGDLPHQAQQGKKYLELAKSINDATKELEEMAAAANAVTVTDSTGKQLFSMDIADQVQKKVDEAGTFAWSWVKQKLKPLAESMQKSNTYSAIQGGYQRVATATGESLGALVDSVKSTETWRHAQVVAEKLGEVPLIKEAKLFVHDLTDEGLVEYLKALWRFSNVAAKNPQLAALMAFTKLEDQIKDPLNEWAKAGDETDQVAVAASGLLGYILQTGTMMASTACDVGAAKRMVCQMLGTVLSAAFGNEQAQDALKEMVPFYSWLMMGEQIADLIQAEDYYGAGKKASELLVTVIGDITVFLPIVKGATVAIKAGNKVSAVLVQALKKTATTIRREVVPIPGGSLKSLMEGCRIKGLCFAPGTSILLADGSTKPIESMQVGDKVLSADPEGGEVPISAEVSKIQQGYTQSLVVVRIDTDQNGHADGTVRATKNHPFWVVGVGWTDAQSLQSGDLLIQPNGKQATVVTAEIKEGASETWDLTVKGTHNFYVACGQGAVRVHNLDKTQYRAIIVYVIPEVGTDRFYIGKASMPISAGAYSAESIDARSIFDSRYSSLESKSRVERRQGIKLDFLKARYPTKVFYAQPGADTDMMLDVVSQLEHNLIQAHKPPHGTGKAVNVNRGINPKNAVRKNRIKNNFDQFRAKFTNEVLKAMGIDC